MHKLGNRAKKIKRTRPLESFVSKEQILAFDPQRPETFTESRTVNEVLLAIEAEGTAQRRRDCGYPDLYDYPGKFIRKHVA